MITIDFDEIAREALADRPDAAALKAALLARLPELITSFLGKANTKLSTRQEWRFGRHGSLAVVRSGDKRGCWYDHETAEGGDIFALIMRQGGCSFPEALGRAAEFLGGAYMAPAVDLEPAVTLDTDRSRDAEKIWTESADPHGTLVEEYLASRGLTLSDTIADEVLRFHPRLWCDGEMWPGMVALVRDVRSNAPQAIHRTFLTHDGSGRLAKKMLGPVKGSAIKLSPDEDVCGGLTIGEGIETCLSALRLGFSPVWAVGSAGAIADFPADIAAVESLTILLETDEANRRASEKCRDRWLAAGREVSFARPLIEGDMNDVLRRAAA